MADEDTSQPAPSESVEPPETTATEPAEPVSEQSAIEMPPETPTAQIPSNEPLPPEPEPITTSQNQASQPTPPPATSNFARDLLTKARATIQFRKTTKLEKIITELNKRGKITNDEVEKLLHVSDATATRYLSELEKEGKIKQVGKTGDAVIYTHI